MSDYFINTFCIKITCVFTECIKHLDDPERDMTYHCLREIQNSAMKIKMIVLGVIRRS